MNRLKVGVKVAPSLWQKFVDKILEGIQGNLLIQIVTFKETLTQLKRVFEVLKTYGLQFNKDKCNFKKNSIKYLRHTREYLGTGFL